MRRPTARCRPPHRVIGNSRALHTTLLGGELLGKGCGNKYFRSVGYIVVKLRSTTLGVVMVAPTITHRSRSWINGPALEKCRRQVVTVRRYNTQIVRSELKWKTSIRPKSVWPAFLVISNLFFYCNNASPTILYNKPIFSIASNYAATFKRVFIS